MTPLLKFEITLCFSCFLCQLIHGHWRGLVCRNGSVCDSITKAKNENNLDFLRNFSRQLALGQSKPNYMKADIVGRGIERT